jgi:hypothetical protein
MSTLPVTQTEAVALPGAAFDAEGKDVLGPSVKVLMALNLLPDTQQSGISQAFSGPPDSVSIIEAGATAASKWWAVSGAVAFGGTWAAVGKFWNGNSDANQRVMLIAAAIASAALILAIGYLLASDLRGRAAAMVATIDARARVVAAVTSVARSDVPVPATAGPRFLPVTAHKVKYTAVPKDDESGWIALAMSAKDDGTDAQLFIGKDNTFVWAPVTDVLID